MPPFKHLLVTAGPTREYLDPVRFLSNCSTGVLGYEIARAGKRRKLRVTLITGPTSLTPPRGVRVIAVETASELERALKREFHRHDCLIMTAAVCDFTPVSTSRQKIRRGRGMTVQLRCTPDLLQTLAKRKGGQLVVGCALETQQLRQNATRKLRAKQLDYLLATQFSSSHNPFGKRQMRSLLLSRTGQVTQFPPMSKPRLARALLNCLTVKKGSSLRL